jgi:hypothetical protein
MAAGDITLFKKFKLNQNNGVGAIDLDTDTLKLMLTTATYVANMDTDEFVSTPVTNQVALGTAYVTGGPTLATVTFAVSGEYAVLDAADLVIARDAAAGFADARWGVLYKATGVNGTSRLIALLDLGSAKSIIDGALTFQWNASGIIRF